MDNTIDWVFPTELWYKISHHLESKDLSTLIQVNKTLHKTFKSQDYLFHIAKQKWFASIDNIDDCQCTMNDTFKEYDDDDVFKYCIRRMKLDEEMELKLKDIASITDKSEVVFEKMSDLVTMEESDSFIPKALKIMERKLDDLPLRFYASQFIMARRHLVAFRIIEKYACNINCKRDDSLKELPEEILFKLSHLDPAFDKLLPYRNKVLNQVVEKVKQNPLLKLNPQNPVITVLLARETFFDVVNFTKYSEYCCQEDTSILRVYAGEAKGTHLINMAILHKIVTMLGIKAQITRGFLIIQVSENPEGNFYVHLSRKRIEIKTYDEVMQDFNQFGPDSVEREMFFIPLQASKLLNIALKPGEYDTLRLVDENDNDDLFYHIYPISKVEFSHTFMLVAFYYFKYGHDSIGATDPDIAVRFYEELYSKMPYDFALTTHTNFCKRLGFDKLIAYMNSGLFRGEIFGYFCEEMPINQDDLKFKLGEIVEDELELSVVYHAVNVPNDSIYYYSYCGNGRKLIFNEDGFKKVDQPNERQLKALITDPDIGLLFHHYDKDLGRFVPNKVLAESSALSIT